MSALTSIQAVLKRFQAGFRLFDGDQLNNLITFLTIPLSQYVVATDTAAFTATGAQVAGAQNNVLNLTGTLAAGRAITMPTASNLIAAVPNAFVGQTFLLTIINSSSGNFAWTVTTATGITLTGTMTIAQNTQRTFLVTITSATAVTLQSQGTIAVTAV